ncbi:hypothetical protein [Mycobacterium spongiae]|uniref:Uncharacterized protein n=1 Tax=Mycobacterium spongiae TaxID=886343 RepID=A0A975JZS2_9MYCO|nr:hypothetical protein [Mycobacterium spongiae]QUR68730.1 hypothetical protein F6B93_18105 [Mycobacterium spongiae]
MHACARRAQRHSRTRRSPARKRLTATPPRLDHPNRVLDRLQGGWQWEWLAPFLALAAATVWVIRRRRHRDARLVADADRQNALVAEGDGRGVYGDYPPAAA